MKHKITLRRIVHQFKVVEVEADNYSEAVELSKTVNFDQPAEMEWDEIESTKAYKIGPSDHKDSLKLGSFDEQNEDQIGLLWAHEKPWRVRDLRALKTWLAHTTTQRKQEMCEQHWLEISKFFGTKTRNEAEKIRNYIKNSKQ